VASVRLLTVRWLAGRAKGPGLLLSRTIRSGLLTTVLASVAITMGGCLPATAFIETLEPPAWAAPAVPSIAPSSELRCREGEIPLLESDLVDTRVIGCDLLVRDPGIRIAACEFVDSRLLVEGAADLVIENCVFRDRYRTEEAAINFYRAIRPVVRGCLIERNFIGVGAHESVDVHIERCTFLGNDGHNAITIDLGSTGEVRDCFFANSFPHAILVGSGTPRGRILIEHNWIEYTVEDAINFENFSSSEPSLVRDNIILNTGWAGINVEYLSWQANLTIDGNFIEASGTDLDLFPRHPDQPEPYAEGWKHGILLEDCSGVTVCGNTITACEGTGIELVNARDVALEFNLVTACNLGIALRSHNEASLVRPMFPLPESEAGISSASAEGNTLEQNVEGDWQIDPGCVLE